MTVKTVALSCLTACAVSLSGTAVAAAAEPVVIDSGHVDFLHTTMKGDKLTLDLLDSTAGTQERAAEDVVLVVKKQAWKEKSQFDKAYDPNFINSDGAYLPQAQDHKNNLLWAGWEPTACEGTINFAFSEVTGPGKVYLYGTDNDAATGKLVTKALVTQDSQASYELASNAALNVPCVHAHANWVFTEPGTYTMKVQATTGDKTSNAATYTWKVEDRESAEQPQTPEQPQQPEEGLSVGAIVGIVFGVLAGLGALAAVVANALGLLRF